MNNAFIRSFGAAVADVRERLISEGWFGKLEKPDYTGFGSRPAEGSIPSPQHLRLMHEQYKAFFEPKPEKAGQAPGDPARDAPAREAPGHKPTQHDIER
ncbi:hypothetical protein ACO2Q1_16300 [Brevundimonas sp. VNH65]|uniref:hypothetical protein n=1 Tax=Brevundimonas sp. VNH65 TaxID=3400917 RepID=UPI003BFD69EE